MRLGVDAINLRADERGMGRYVRTVLTALGKRGDVELTLFARDPRNLAPYRAIAGARTRVAPPRAAKRRGAFDAVWYPWNGIRFPAHAPALVTINDDFAFAFPARGFIARRREQRPIRVAVERAAAVATISAWSRAQLADRFKLDPHRIGVLPLAPDEFFTPGFEASPFDEPYVLAVSGAERRKNLPFLVDVFGAAFPERDVRLVFAGTLDDTTQAAIRRSTAPIAEFSRCDDALLRRLYRNASAVAVPSIAEGFGLVAVEAQACGTAVIAAKTSALPEAIGDAGLLVELEDREGWIAALRETVNDESAGAKLRALGAARWAFAPRDPTTPALLAMLQRLVDDRA